MKRIPGMVTVRGQSYLDGRGDPKTIMQMIREMPPHRDEDYEADNFTLRDRSWKYRHYGL